MAKTAVKTAPAPARLIIDFSGMEFSNRRGQRLVSRSKKAKMVVNTEAPSYMTKNLRNLFTVLLG